MIKRALLLSSGLGTRLRPLTEKTPKPLVPIFHKPLLTFALDHLLALGIDQIGINIRYLWESFYKEFQVQPTAEGKEIGFYEKTALHFFKEDSYLDTGGSLRNARHFLEQETFLIHNGDILTNISFDGLFDQHKKSGAIATLLLREEGGPLNVSYDEKQNRVTDIRGHFSQSEHPLFLYCGIAVMEPTIFKFITREGECSLVEALLNAIKAGDRVGGFVSRSGFWSDIGTPESYLQTHFKIANAPWKFHYPLRGPAAATWPEAIHPSAAIARTVKLEGTVIVGPDARIEENATVSNSVLLPRATAKSGETISNRIVLAS